MSVIAATDDNFQSDVLESDLPVLVDFFAQWCGQCKQLSVTVETFAKNNTDVRVVKIDVDVSPGIAGQYGLRGVPTLMMFNRGERIAAYTGAMSLTRLGDWVREHIGARAEAG